MPAVKLGLFRQLFGPEASVAGPEANRWRMFVPAVLTHMRQEGGYGEKGRHYMIC